MIHPVCSFSFIICCLRKCCRYGFFQKVVIYCQDLNLAMESRVIGNSNYLRLLSICKLICLVNFA